MSNSRSPGVRPAAGLISSFDQNGLVIFDLRQEIVYAANCVGADIWRGLQDQRSLESIVGDIAASYGLPHEEARNGVRSFIGDLALHRLANEEPHA